MVFFLGLTVQQQLSVGCSTDACTIFFRDSTAIQIPSTTGARQLSTKTAGFPKNSKEASVVEMALSHMPVSEL
jgi:hypothetical protein